MTFNFNIESRATVEWTNVCFQHWKICDIVLQDLNFKYQAWNSKRFFFSHFKISMESRPCSVQMYERNKIHLDNYKYQITNIQSWRLMPVPNVLSMFKIDKRSRSSLVAIALAQSVRTVGNRALKLMPRVTLVMVTLKGTLAATSSEHRSIHLQSFTGNGEVTNLYQWKILERDDSVML